MAFNINNFELLTLPSSSNVLTMYSYVTATDSIATVKAPNYFSGVRLFLGCTIACKASDDVDYFIVNTLTTNERGIATAVTVRTIQSFNAFDAVTASFLTTSLIAFSAAAPNTAIPITVSEYLSLGGISTKCGALDTTMSLPNGTIISPASLTVGFYTSYTTMGTGKTFFAFTTKYVNPATTLQVKAGATALTLNNLHTNLVDMPATVQSYYVIRTPTVVSNSAGWNIASFQNSTIVQATTPPSGTYQYANGNVLSINNPSTDAEVRLQALAR
jgi:hypothetical protein